MPFVILWTGYTTIRYRDSSGLNWDERHADPESALESARNLIANNGEFTGRYYPQKAAVSGFEINRAYERLLAEYKEIDGSLQMTRESEASVDPPASRWPQKFRRFPVFVGTSQQLPNGTGQWGWMEFADSAEAAQMRVREIAENPEKALIDRGDYSSDPKLRGWRITGVEAKDYVLESVATGVRNRAGKLMMKMVIRSAPEADSVAL